jgi:hypothetical protein
VGRRGRGEFSRSGGKQSTHPLTTGSDGTGTHDIVGNTTTAVWDAGVGQESSSSGRNPMVLGSSSVPPKTDESEVSLWSDIKDGVSCSLVVSDQLWPLSGVPANTTGSFLKAGPKLLVKECAELPLALLMLSALRRSRLLANVYARR